MNFVFSRPMVCVSGIAWLLSSMVYAAPQWPDTAASRIAQQRLQAFNSADTTQLRQYQQAHEATLDIDAELGLYAMTGGLDAIKIQADGQHAVTVYLREHDGDQVGVLRLQLTPAQRGQQPEQVQAVQLQPLAEVPADLMPERISASALNRQLDHKAQALTHMDRFAGTLWVEHQGQLQLSGSYGAKNRTPATPHQLDSRFRIGSMYKMFTAVAVLQLWEQGRIVLDAPLSRYLPDYPNRAVATSTTIRHLLTHTAGLGDIFDNDWPAQRLLLREHPDYIQRFAPRAAEFTAGRQERYSNYGFIVLGAVIERVTGQSYADYLQQHIFAVAGMQDTGSLPETQVQSQLSVGYTQTAAGWQDAKDTLPWRGTAAGGGYSTAHDVQRFAHALLQGRLIKADTLAQATRSQVKSGLYGLGFQLGGEGLGRYFGHIGGAQGMNGALRIYPLTGDVVIALSNMDPPGAEKLVEYYSNRMPLLARPANQPNAGLAPGSALEPN